MLAYLEDLCAALIAHDAIAIHRLLAHPLARSLPRQVREEALAISRASPSSLRAPIQTLRFYHQSLQLRESNPAAPPSEPDSDEAGGSTGGSTATSSGDETGSRDPSAGVANQPTDPQRRVPPPATHADPASAVGDAIAEGESSPRRDQIELPFDSLSSHTAFAA